MTDTCRPGEGVTHHTGCPCHEAGWADRVESAERERDEAETIAAQNHDEIERLLRVLAALRELGSWPPCEP